MTKTISLGLLFISSFTLSTTAQQIITDRPDQTEASSIVPKGSFQWESGFVLINNEEGTLKHQSLAAPSNLFRIGVTNWFELRVFNQYETYKDRSVGRKMTYSGFNDIELGTKIQILQREDINAEIAILSHVIMPTGDAFFSLDDYGSINKLSISHTISDAIGLGYNIGYNNYGEGDGDASYSLAVGFGLTDKVAAYIETYGEFIEFDEHVSNFDAGFTYLLKNNFQLDYSFGFGLNHDMNYMSAGFSWNISNPKN